jgi:glycosyltransferase involved in cell wall biosynthesis
MKVLLLGDALGNSGPSNVHKEFLQHWPAEDEIGFVHAQDKAGFIREGLSKGWKADVIVSPLLNFAMICTQDALHLMGRPVVCFNHGYVAFENEMNHLGHSQWWVNRYKAALRSADLVVANSGFQERFVLGCQPELAGKTTHILLGLDRFQQMESHSVDGGPVICVSGGSRDIKGNDVVARALALMRVRGIECRLDVYGKVDAEMHFLDAFPKGDVVRVLGQVSHDRFIDGLNVSNLFVMNSRHESFGLSALDALRAGCSVLISKDSGVLEVLSPKGSDVIENCEDAKEVADKMAYLLEHPNAKRLYESIDFDELSWDVQTRKLREMCVGVVERKRGGTR